MDETEKRSLRESLHSLNNSLNAIAMNAELARLQIDDDDRKPAVASLNSILDECRNAARVSRSVYGIFELKKDGAD